MTVKTKSWVQPDEVARYCGVTCSTVWSWITDGRLRAAHLPTGHIRVLARDVMRCLLRDGRPIPAELGDLGNKYVLIIDRNGAAGEDLARLLGEASGCRTAVAATAEEARGILDGAEPDVVLITVHSWGAGNGFSDLLILAEGREDVLAREMEQEVAFRMGDILPASLTSQQLIARVADVLLG